MEQMSRQECESAVDLVVGTYNGLGGIWDADSHFSACSAIYGESPVDSSPAAKAEIENQGRIIAVLFWRLAQAKGFIPVSDDGSTPAGPGYPPYFEPTLESD